MLEKALWTVYVRGAGFEGQKRVVTKSLQEIGELFEAASLKKQMKF